MSNSIYTAVLPTLDLTLDHALVVELTLCRTLMDCIRADTNHVNKIMQGLLTLTEDESHSWACFAGNGLIYRVRWGDMFLSWYFLTNIAERSV